MRDLQPEHFELRRHQQELVRTIPPDGLLGEDGKFVTGTGQSIVHVHPGDACVGRHCVIHNPSDHVMRGFRTHWRADRGIMERICPHGVGHPDPDDMAYHDLVNPGHAEGVHGCDGCCAGAA